MRGEKEKIRRILLKKTYATGFHDAATNHFEYSTNGKSA